MNGDIDGSGEVDISDAVSLLGWLFFGTNGPVPIACPPRGGGPLPSTGQTECYDDVGNQVDCARVDLPGQDGFYRIGCPVEGRFVDNGDGTTSDACTGLTWQRRTADIDGDGSIGEGDLVDWRTALLYCDRLVLGGHSDWRLPNVRELFSIVDFTRFDPSIAPVFAVFGIIGPLEGHYWTSTSFLDTPDDAWVINFSNGSITDNQKTTNPWDHNVQYVIAVRGGL